MEIKIEGEWFIDEKGRKLILRGINLSGSSKVPYNPKGYTHIKTDFMDYKNVSYVGRPFPINEANEHFSRLKHWGFNSIRFLITWEAIEHAGPLNYDKEYLDYLEEIIKIACNKYGFYVFIDPHQDVWSRVTGGDGAPLWTFEKIGLDFTKFAESNCAWTMQHEYDENNPKSYPPMFWPQNQLRLPVATMFTLFFAGKDFAKSILVDGINPQEYLRNYFYRSLKQVARRVKHIQKVIGFNTLNEPSQGWIGIKVDGSNYNYKETLGHAMTPIDAMAIGAGIPRSVGYRIVKRFGIKEIRKDLLNPNKISCWFSDLGDIWRKEGVWEIDENNEPKILNNDYFMEVNGHTVDFYKDYLSPFIVEFATKIREEFEDAIIFFEGSSELMLKGQARFSLPSNLLNIVNEPHWYDVATVGTKRAMLKASFDIVNDKPVVGKSNVVKMFSAQLKMMKKIVEDNEHKIPTIIGEFGVPFDLNNKKGFEIWKTDPEHAWDDHIECLNAYYNAMDDNLLSCFLWNYTADNTNKWGDGWNLEDFSIYSIDQQINSDDINGGGRAITGFCRPYCVACSGIPLSMKFDLKSVEFLFEYKTSNLNNYPTIIYVPKIQYINGYTLELSPNLKVEEENINDQLLYVIAKKTGIHSIIIKKI
ncbi:MAG: cellulase family glycosylhydrolase [Promethearchaeota archaeon]